MLLNRPLGGSILYKDLQHAIEPIGLSPHTYNTLDKVVGALVMPLNWVYAPLGCESMKTRIG